MARQEFIEEARLAVIDGDREVMTDAILTKSGFVLACGRAEAGQIAEQLASSQEFWNIPHIDIRVCSVPRTPEPDLIGFLRRMRKAGLRINPAHSSVRYHH